MLHKQADNYLFVCLPELCEALGSNVLTGVLNASQQVGNKLMDGAFVLHCSRNTLSNFNLVTFTVNGHEKKKQVSGGISGIETSILSFTDI